MAVTRKSKKPILVVMPRRSQRLMKLHLNTRFITRKPRKHKTNIANLPDEILFMIFSNFDTNELFSSVSKVCRKWRTISLAPILWKEISVTNLKMPTEVVIKWIRNAPHLRKFTMHDRNDANKVIEALSKYSRKLESITLKNCWGSDKTNYIRSASLCDLVTKCNNLHEFNLTNSRFYSSKFFRLMSMQEHNVDVIKKCKYMGPMTNNQLKTLFCTLADTIKNEAVTVNCVLWGRKFKLKEVIYRCQEGHEPLAALIDIWHSSIQIEQNDNQQDQEQVLIMMEI